MKVSGFGAVEVLSFNCTKNGSWVPSPCSNTMRPGMGLSYLPSSVQDWDNGHNDNSVRPSSRSIAYMYQEPFATMEAFPNIPLTNNFSLTLDIATLSHIVESKYCQVSCGSGEEFSFTLKPLALEPSSLKFKCVEDRNV